MVTLPCHATDQALSFGAIPREQNQCQVLIGRRSARIIAAGLIVGLLPAIGLGTFWSGASKADRDRIELVIDGSRTISPIRPLHGVNCGPVTQGGTLDLSPSFRQIAPPLVRLHDCHWPNPDVVDVHVVFPDPRADPGRPESYDFARTDEYLRSILAVRSGIVFRLGESIEHEKVKRHVHPPADTARWADVCLGIIRHYNEGWAHGFRHNIKYWEIWNEPDNRPAMWTGTDEDYFRLYRTAAKAIKKRFPHIMVGGPGLGNTGQMKGDRLDPAPFLRRFLDHCRKDAAPLDFFSWHVYTNDPQELVRRARAVRHLLDEAGFRRTESHLNEWNYLPDNDWTPMLSSDARARQHWFEEIGGPAGAAFSAGALLLLQDAPLDAANYYSADAHGFGLFNGHGVPHKSFFALKAFKALADTAQRLPVRGSLPDGVAAGAGLNRDRTEIIVLLSKFAGPSGSVAITPSNLPWEGATQFEVSVLDAERDLTSVQTGRQASGTRLVQTLRAPMVYLIKLRCPINEW
jgi:hypothetical protein